MTKWPTKPSEPEKDSAEHNQEDVTGFVPRHTLSVRLYGGTFPEDERICKGTGPSVANSASANELSDLELHARSHVIMDRASTCKI
jgi:hypothetical protein